MTIKVRTKGGYTLRFEDAVKAVRELGGHLRIIGAGDEMLGEIKDWLYWYVSEEEEEESSRKILRRIRATVDEKSIKRLGLEKTLEEIRDTLPCKTKDC